MVSSCGDLSELDAGGPVASMFVVGRSSFRLDDPTYVICVGNGTPCITHGRTV